VISEKKKTSAEARGVQVQFSPPRSSFCLKGLEFSIISLDTQRSRTFQNKYRQGFAKNHMVYLPDYRVIFYVGYMMTAENRFKTTSL
jgi:hypothetical protein